MRATHPEELIGRTVLETVHPDSREVAEERLRLTESGQVAPFEEIKLIRLDGTTAEVEIVAMPLNSSAAAFR